MSKALKALGALEVLRSALAFSAVSAFGVTACNGDPPTGENPPPLRGSLEVTIGGLPTGQPAVVTVTGPNNFSRGIASTIALADLEPGNYGITAANVDRFDGRWAATPATQNVVVTAGSPATTASVTYALVSGRMAVSISGLSGANANVTVTGPSHFSRSVTASTTLEYLPPGEYTITAGDVFAGTTFHPIPTTQTVQVAVSTTPVVVNITYYTNLAALSVIINGLPVTVNAAVQVTGPAGFSQQLTATQTFEAIPTGQYTITASPVATDLTTHTPAPATQNLTIAAGGRATMTITYSPTPLVLHAQQQWAGRDLGDVVYLASPPNDTRIFVVDQQGRIYVVENNAPLATPFLDIASLVLYGGEQGLLSLAFDPAYATNGRFYVYYTDRNGDITVDRFTATGDMANVGSRINVITIPHPTYANHNGGLALFGPDGMLYLATGDGGGGGDPNNNAQNLDVLLGKLLRIDVTSLPYMIPAGNPYAGATPGRDEIWAHGLRNPWRYAFDPPAGTLYIADVGQDHWEEVNAVTATTAGLNYGWRIMEGNHCYPGGSCNATGLTLPVLEYSHANGNCSVTGGFVYRGAAIPELTGHYLFADYCVGVVRSFRLSGGQALDERTWSIGNVGNIKSFGLDAAGEIYILSGNGAVYRVVKP